MYRHHKWQTGPKHRNEHHGDKSMSAGCCVSWVCFTLQQPSTPIFSFLFCACDPKLTFISHDLLSYHDTTLLKFPFLASWKERLLWLENLGVSCCYFPVNNAFVPYLSRSLKSVLRSLSFDVSPIFRSALSTTWPQAGMGCTSPR